MISGRGKMDDEKKAYLKRMYQEKGFLHDHHKILAAEHFELLKNSMTSSKRATPKEK